MAARSMGSATVSFGLVSIPCQVFTSAESTKAIRFRMLHAKCGRKLRQQLFCEVEEEVVDRNDTVKGYEFAKDQFVTFTHEELKAMEAESTRAIEIKEFIDEDLVDPIYFSKAYYLGPGQGGGRAYRLLVEAMKKTGRVGLAKYSARGKEYLVMLRTHDGALVMQQLHYADEVKPVSEISIPDTEVDEAELALAIQLIDQVAADEFLPEHYEDGVGNRVREMIQSKVEGEEVIASAPEAPQAQIIDLMEALKSSLSVSTESVESETGTSGKRKSAKRSPRSEKAEKVASDASGS